MKVCQNCGKENKQNSKFCNNCGNNLANTNLETSKDKKSIIKQF